MTEAELTRGHGSSGHPGTVRVWDPLVRVFHWSLALSFLVAWVSAEEWDALHETTGYVIAALIAIRVVWGLVGSRHARFSDFVYRPSTIIGFILDSLRLKASRYVGHNPAGGAMVIALLATLGGVCLSGYLMTTEALWGVEWVQELHEVLANLTLVLVGVHVLGVLLASYEHGENLVKAMWTGRKRPGG